MRVALIVGLILSAGLAHAQTPPPPPPTTGNEGALGTVEVTGAAAVALPKLAVVPLTGGDATDATAREVLKNDLDRIGLYDVIDEAAMPAGPFGKDDPFDIKPWKAKGISFVVRARKDGDTLAAEAWLVGKADDPVASPKVSLANGERRAAHELADELLSALTGRKGPFASRLAFTMRTAKGRQVFASDIEGNDRVAHGNKNDTALSPTFGPGGDVWYTISKDFDPFRLAHGKAATELPLKQPGSVLSVSFSPDRARMAVSIMSNEASKLFVGKADGSDLAAIETPKLPNRPVLGPLGKLAYVASGGGPQRVYVGGQPVSPAGFHASAPTFCDSPQGLLVVFTVGVGSGADLVATDTSGGGLRRLTQGHGSNAYPACSPDGRLIAFFSTGRSGKTPGLYVLPLSNPAHIRKLSDDHGESLAWAR